MAKDSEKKEIFETFSREYLKQHPGTGLSNRSAALASLFFISSVSLVLASLAAALVVWLVLKLMQERAAYFTAFLAVLISMMVASAASILRIPFLANIVLLITCSFLLSKWTTAPIFPQAAFATAIMMSLTFVIGLFM